MLDDGLFDAGPEALLHSLTASQRAAVTAEAAPVCILACAGAGKTRVLTRRIAYRVSTGSATARSVLALTFTRKAAVELRSRLDGLGLRDEVAAGTFHSTALAQLQRWWADRGQKPPVVLDRKAPLLATLTSRRRSLARVSVAEIAGHIEWAKARMVTPDRFEEAVREAKRSLPPGADVSDLAAVYARYENEKLRRGVVDFDDLLAHCADAIETDQAFAAAQRWRWRHIFVDEFQDLNPLQHRLLLAWLGPSTDLFVVGDPNQAIYGWNGADPGLLAQVPHRWPGAQVLHLDDNHRSTPQIVAAASSVLGLDGLRLRSASADGSLPRVRAHPSEKAEAAAIACDLRRAHADGRRWSSMAVLTRTNAQLVPIQAALAAAGVPYWAPFQSALLSEPEIQRTLGAIRADPRRPVQAVVADLLDAADTGGGGDDHVGALSALVDLARTFQSQEPAGTAGQWLAWLPAALRDDGGARRSPDAVTLCSFHRAKGLEWDSVWVAGVESGLVPISHASSPSAEAEERRLLYVALTRAGTHLSCTWAQQRTFGTRAVPRDPSPWLAAIAAAGRDNATANPGEWRAVLRSQRDGLAAPTPRVASNARSRPRRGRAAHLRAPTGMAEPDGELVESLRAWRTETARATGVPAYVILHDVTVAALASLRPSTVEELLAVPGLGPVKASRYGDSLLTLIGGADRRALPG